MLTAIQLMRLFRNAMTVITRNIYETLFTINGRSTDRKETEEISKMNSGFIKRLKKYI